MHRRTLLASLPALALVPTPRHDAGQLRIAGTPAQAAALYARTGIPTTAAALHGPALLDALDAGHLEAATLDAATLAHATTRMGGRLTLLGGHPGAMRVSRTVLPAALRSAMAAALA